MHLTIVVCGDRNWIDEGTIRARLTQLLARVKRPAVEILIVHGDTGNDKARGGGRGQKGADRIAGRIAAEMGFRVQPVPAHWEHAESCPPDCRAVTGLAAGPIRNRAMLALKPFGVLAFHDNIERSKGTKDMVTAAQAAGVPCAVVPRTRAAAA